MGEERDSSTHSTLSWLRNNINIYFLFCQGVNVGRGWGSYDEIERRGLSVTTNSVTVYHSSEKESRQLEEKEWGHFYSAESKITLLTSMIIP